MVEGLRAAKNAAKYTAVAVVILFVLFPLIWMTLTSIKTPGEILLPLPPVWLSADPSLMNYEFLFNPDFPIEVFEMPAKIMWSPILNSLIMAGGGTLLGMAVGCLAAYSISRFRTGGVFIYFIVLSTRMFPPIALLIPLVAFYAMVGLIDSHLGLVLLYAGITVAYVVLMMKSFIDEVPREIEEAAIIDGASERTVFFKITLPLVKGGVFATAFFVFILNWGEFLMALLLTRQEAVTIPVYLRRFFAGAHGGGAAGPLTAASIVAIIPVLVLTLLIRKNLVRGLTFGAIKTRRI